LSVLFLKANATREKRCIAILTDTPVKAAFRDTQRLRQVTKGKRTSEASKRRLLITLKEILRRRGK
jgi:hypothetical protein